MAMRARELNIFDFILRSLSFIYVFINMLMSQHLDMAFYLGLEKKFLFVLFIYHNVHKMHLDNVTHEL